MNIDLNKVKLDNLGYFRFKRLKEMYLLSNDIGKYVFLGDKEFNDFIEGKLSRNSLVYNHLDENGFIYKDMDKQEMALKYRTKHSYLRKGTSLHIIIPTLRCNHSCIYCQAKARSPRDKGYDMSKKTARNVVNRIFDSPSRSLTIEFQGGEPLLNWEVLKYIVNYANKKNRIHKRNISFVMVSNLTLMSKEILKFLVNKKVIICTSLDGPKFIHDHNRPMNNGKSGYELTTRWVKEISFSKQGYCGALVTLTGFSLKYPEEIIREYLKWNILNIPLRPVSVLGRGGDRRKEIGVTADQFLKFYVHSLDYIIELNRITGQVISERMAKVCLQKIFNPVDPGYLDLRSPCGAGCGQLAYNYDGDVYSCDEGRMVDDNAFKLGNVNSDTYDQLIHSRQVKTLVLASCLDGLYCDYCVYKPYCGVCPVLSWKECGNIYAQNKSFFMCNVNRGMFDYIFKSLLDKKKTRILKAWIKR